MTLIIEIKLSAGTRTATRFRFWFPVKNKRDAMLSARTTIRLVNSVPFQDFHFHMVAFSLSFIGFPCLHHWLWRGENETITLIFIEIKSDCGMKNQNAFARIKRNK